jgi:hypothetical protein
MASIGLAANPSLYTKLGFDPQRDLAACITRGAISLSSPRNFPLMPTKPPPTGSFVPTNTILTAGYACPKESHDIPILGHNHVRCERDQLCRIGPIPVGIARTPTSGKPEGARNHASQV